MCHDDHHNIFVMVNKLMFYHLRTRCHVNVNLPVLVSLIRLPFSFNIELGKGSRQMVSTDW